METRRIRVSVKRWLAPAAVLLAPLPWTGLAGASAIFDQQLMGAAGLRCLQQFKVLLKKALTSIPRTK